MLIRSQIPGVAGLFAVPLLFATAPAQHDDTPIVRNTAPGMFQKVPNSPDCITAAVAQGDPTKGASVLMGRGTSGCKVPWHFHTPNEQLMMVNGVGQVEMKGEHAVRMLAGGFAYAPAKHVHQFTCIGGACSFFLHSDAPFDIHYVDQDGNEISIEQALSGSPVSSQAALKQTALAFAGSFRTRDPNEILKYFADDAVAWYPRHPRPVIGRAANFDAWTAYFKNNQAHPVSVDHVDAAASGELGITDGRYLYKDPEDPTAEGGRYLAVWRRLGSAWRIVLVSAHKHDDISGATFPSQ